MKLTIVVGKKTKTISANVVPLKRIYIERSNISLYKGQSLGSTKFKNGSIVRAVYANGARKKLDTYKVSVLKKNSKNLLVAVAYGNCLDKTYVVLKNKPAVSTPTKVPTQAPVPSPTQTPVPSPTQTPVPSPTQTPKFMVTLKSFLEKPIILDGEEVESGFSQEFEEGHEIALEAPEVEGYEFRHWSKNNAILTTDRICKLKISEATEMLAVYKKNSTVEPTQTPVPKFPVTLKSFVGKPVILDGEEVESGFSQEFEEGHEITLEAPKVEGYEFRHWSKNNAILTTDRICKLKINEATEMLAVYRKNSTVEPTQTPTVEPTKVPTQTPTVEPTPIPKFPVTLKSFVGKPVILDGKEVESGFSQEFEEGHEITIEAPEVEGYEFRHWTKNNVIVTTDPKYKLEVNEKAEMLAVYGRKCTVTFSIESGEGKVQMNGQEVPFNEAIEIVRGRSYELKALPGEGMQNTVSWRYDNNTRPFSQNLVYNLTVSEEETNILITFTPIEKATVIYKHSNGAIIRTDSIAPGEEALDPPRDSLWKRDSEFKGWKMNGILYQGNYDAEQFVSEEGQELLAQIESWILSNAGQTLEVEAIYEAIASYNVLVTNGVLLDENHQPIENPVLTGTHVYAVANEPPEGLQFSHWVNNTTGEIVCYYETFEFYVNSNRNISAVYEETPKEIQPIVGFRGEAYNLENPVMIFLTMIDTPDEYENLEWGVLATFDPNVEIIYENVGQGVTKKQDDDTNVMHSKRANSIVRIRSTTGFAEGKTVRARAYARISGPNGVQTIYSSEISFQLL